MDIRITPTRLSGTMEAISSKSFVHRLLICAALSHKETTIHMNGTCEDIFSTVRCIEAMGGSVQADRKKMIVTPFNRVPADASTSKAQAAPIVLRCGESGATARFMLPLAAYFFNNFKLIGEGKLPHRPFAPLCRALSSAGCRFDSETLPIVGTGGIKTGNFEIAGNVSSQFISGLMFLLPLLDADSSITITTPMESAGYVGMTAEIIALFGIAVEKKDNTFRVIGNRRYDSPGVATAEGDWSNAAFFLCMGALGGVLHGDMESAITMEGLYMPSEQGDKAVVEILRRFGAKVNVKGDSVVTVSGGELRATDIDASQIPDLIPVLAVVASVAEGTTRVFNGKRLRLKESDRIQSTFDLLSKLGADIEIVEDGLLIHGRKKLNGGTVDGAGDHRIVMAAATASYVCENQVVIKGFGAVNKSYPSFFGNFKLLGGVADVF